MQECLNVEVRIVPAFKYAACFNGIEEQCPPADAKEAAQTAFRFVCNPIIKEDFDSPAVRDPSRFEDKPCCEQWGLSMWTSEDSARARFAKLLAKQPLIRAKLGTHLAQIALKPEHGVQTVPQKNGHFALHEYENVNLISIAVVKSPL